MVDGTHDKSSRCSCEGNSRVLLGGLITHGQFNRQNSHNSGGLYCVFIVVLLICFLFVCPFPVIGVSSTTFTHTSQPGIPKLRWPLTTKKADPTGYKFGDLWNCSDCTRCAGKSKKHTGADLKANSGDNVFAAAGGVIRSVGSLGDRWGDYLVVDHGTFLTAYLHVSPLQRSGDVKTEKPIATIAAIKDAHLHFQIARGAYERVLPGTHDSRLGKPWTVGQVVGRRGALPSDRTVGATEIGCQDDPLFNDVPLIDPMTLFYDDSPSGKAVLVNPQVKVLPSSAPPGTAFNQPGQGFSPRSGVTVHLQRPDGTQAPTQTKSTDSHGRYSNAWIAPENASPGKYQTWAVDNKTMTKSNVVSFMIAASVDARNPKDSLPDNHVPSDQSAPLHWRVYLNGIGPVRVGMVPHEAAAAVATRLIGNGRSSDSCYYLRPENGPKGVGFMILGNRIARIDIETPRLLTVSGARVGHTESQIKSMYRGQITVDRHKYVQEGHYLIYVPTDQRYSQYRIIFETDGKVVTRYRAGKLPEVEWVEGCS